MAAPTEDEARRRAFGAALRDVLRVRGITQEELAAMVGDVSQAAISAWLSGASAPRSVSLTFAVERALKVKPGSLSQHLGYLPPEALSGPRASVESAVLEDPGLTSDEKEILLAGYRAAKKRHRGRPTKT